MRILTPSFDKIHNRFRINGIHYDQEGLNEVAYSFIKEGEPYERDIGNFLLDWLDEKDYVTVSTSGSTGAPKTIMLKKQAMVNSAIATGDIFKLVPGDKALHCLPIKYIAGRMMLVRAMILGLELDIVPPSSHPFINVGAKFVFCAMVPLQARNCLKELNQIKTLIIGGASISESLKRELLQIRTKVYETYGMTETITHIAVKGIGEPYFKTLPKVSISQDNRDCLVIRAPHLFDDELITNDIVSINSASSFKFLGRYDNVINSGGIKLFPEQIEKKLSEFMDQRFFVAAEADEALGEKVILVVEDSENNIKDVAFKMLDKHERPKSVYAIPEFIETETGKIDRIKTCQSLKK